MRRVLVIGREGDELINSNIRYSIPRYEFDPVWPANHSFGAWQVELGGNFTLGLTNADVRPVGAEPRLCCTESVIASRLLDFQTEIDELHSNAFKIV
jgi:hypothetical protein